MHVSDSQPPFYEAVLKWEFVLQCMWSLYLWLFIARIHEFLHVNFLLCIQNLCTVKPCFMITLLLQSPWLVITATCFVPGKSPNMANRHILIRPLEPVYVFIFSLLVLYVLIKILNFLKKIVFAFWMLIKEQLFRSLIICDASVKTSREIWPYPINNIMATLMIQSNFTARCWPYTQGYTVPCICQILFL